MMKLAIPVVLLISTLGTNAMIVDSETFQNAIDKEPQSLTDVRLYEYKFNQDEEVEELFSKGTVSTADNETQRDWYNSLINHDCITYTRADSRGPTDDGRYECLIYGTNRRNSGDALKLLSIVLNMERQQKEQEAQQS